MIDQDQTLSRRWARSLHHARRSAPPPIPTATGPDDPRGATVVPLDDVTWRPGEPVPRHLAPVLDGLDPAPRAARLVRARVWVEPLEVGEHGTVLDLEACLGGSLGPEALWRWTLELRYSGPGEPLLRRLASPDQDRGRLAVDVADRATDGGLGRFVPLVRLDAHHPSRTVVATTPGLRLRHPRHRAGRIDVFGVGVLPAEAAPADRTREALCASALR